VEQAFAVGHRVMAAVRKSANFPAGVGLIATDVMNPASLLPAVRGQDAVLCALGSKLTFEATDLFSKGTSNLLNAMNQEGVRRLVCITGMGAGDSKGHGGFLYDKIFKPLLLKQIYLDKDRQEALLRVSSVDWTIVRPAKLTNGKLTRHYRALTDLTGITMGEISRADVAHFVLDCAQDPRALRQTYNLTY
jgi:putative NADH-flavin reductase